MNKRKDDCPEGAGWNTHDNVLDGGCWNPRNALKFENGLTPQFLHYDFVWQKGVGPFHNPTTPEASYVVHWIRPHYDGHNKFFATWSGVYCNTLEEALAVYLGRVAQECKT